MYDIFFAVHNNEEKNKIRHRFPLAKFCVVDENKSIQDAIYDAQRRSLTKMFWFVDQDYEILDESLFLTEISEWDQKYIHVYKEKLTGLYRGVYLIPKTYRISRNEAEHVFFINKKEIDFVASCLKNMDIFFISYNEINADQNWLSLKERFPNAQRIDKVKGIHQAHIAAAKKSSTRMFWVVDGDALIEENFDFPFADLSKSLIFFKTVHVFQSINPINKLIYGYGGVKLLPKILTMKVDTTAVDMTTSISSHFVSVPVVSNTSSFNTDPFNTWKSAFRECVKLSSKVIINQDDTDTAERLEIWCTKGEEEQHGKFAILGAKMGRDFGSKHKDDSDMLSKINDWQWLNETFSQIKN